MTHPPRQTAPPEILARRARQRSRLKARRRTAAAAATALVVISASVAGAAVGSGSGQGVSAPPIESPGGDAPAPAAERAGAPTTPAPQRVNPTLEELGRRDPESLTTFDRAKMTSLWAELLLRARARGWRGRVNGPVSGLRTRREQLRLWRCFQRGECPPAFAPDGPSRHLLPNERVSGAWSQAADVSHPVQLIRIATKLGVSLHQPYPAEPWHVEALTPFALSETP